MQFSLLSFLLICLTPAAAQNIDNAYKGYDFKSGERTLFEDNFNYQPGEKIQGKWEFTGGGGAASIVEHQGEKCLSIDAYYTKLKPILFAAKVLPDSFTIEYDTWLDHGYDGNPGIEIQIRQDEDKNINITPNKHDLVITLPNGETSGKQNPDEYFGEGKFYDRWVHISIAVYKKQLKVYLDQYKMLEVTDDQLRAQYIVVSGNTSDKMPILLKNFRIATGFPAGLNFENGKFITRAIKFDVNKATLKPESITVIRQVKDYLDKNAATRLEIDGHTDSDGSDDSNIKLSQQRADAVKAQLISMGIAEIRLGTKGFGETKPIDAGNTPEAKANNRRVEFVIVK